MFNPLNAAEALFGLKGLKDGQGLQELVMAQLDVRQHLLRLARKYQDDNDHIARILADHHSGAPVNTLRNIARNIRF